MRNLIIFTFDQYWDNEIKEYQMAGTRTRVWKKQKVLKNCSENLLEKELLEYLEAEERMMLTH